MLTSVPMQGKQVFFNNKRKTKKKNCHLEGLVNVANVSELFKL